MCGKTFLFLSEVYLIVWILNTGGQYPLHLFYAIVDELLVIIIINNDMTSHYFY